MSGGNDFIVAPPAEFCFGLTNQHPGHNRTGFGIFPGVWTCVCISESVDNAHSWQFGRFGILMQGLNLGVRPVRWRSQALCGEEKMGAIILKNFIRIGLVYCSHVSRLTDSGDKGI